MKVTKTYALARPNRLRLDIYARLTGVHPELIRRLVALGLLETTRDAGGGLWFDTTEVRAMARIQRLHNGLNLNYAALGLVIDLLDRIEQLERLERHHRQHQAGEDRWT
ncbi:MAG: MerR family transcriptional regulator [Marmoricola sp.]|nr:MerR family transcriptional regulator [Marmoricola sp.]